MRQRRSSKRYLGVYNCRAIRRFIMVRAIRRMESCGQSPTTMSILSWPARWRKRVHSIHFSETSPVDFCVRPAARFCFSPTPSSNRSRYAGSFSSRTIPTTPNAHFNKRLSWQRRNRPSGFTPFAFTQLSTKSARRCSLTMAMAHHDRERSTKKTPLWKNSC